MLQVKVEDVAVRRDVRETGRRLRARRGVRGFGRPGNRRRSGSRRETTRLLRSGSAPVLEAVELGVPASDAKNDLVPADVARAAPGSIGTPLDHDVERDEVHLLPLDEWCRDRAFVAGVAIA